MRVLNTFMQNEARRTARAERYENRQNLVIVAIGGITLGVLCAMFI